MTSDSGAPKYGAALSPSARKFINSAPRAVRRQVGYDIYLLQQDPKRFGAEKMEGKVGGQDAWRFRSGSYRIVYRVEDQILIVYVIDIGDRKEIYKKKKRK